MKIVHISSSIDGGAGKAAFRLHKALINYGINSVFISVGYDSTADKNNHHISIPYPWPSFFEKVLNKIGFPITNGHKNQKKTKGLRGKFEILSFPLTDFKIEDHPELEDADIVHLHWIAGFVNYPKFFKKLKHKKILWTLHDMNPIMGVFHYENDLKTNILYFRELEKEMLNIKIHSLRHSDNVKFICLCSWMKGEVQKREFFKNFQVQVIPNIIDDKFRYIEKTEAKRTLAINTTKINLLFIADNISNKRKGADLFIEALQLLPNKEELSLILVGRGGIDIDLDIEIKEFNYVSSNEQLSLIYSAADILVIPSREDNLPNTMVESMFCGTPILSFNIGGMRDHIQNGFNGFLIDAFNVPKLVETISNLPSSIRLFNSRKIRQYAIENFSSEYRVKDYLNLYENHSS